MKDNDYLSTKQAALVVGLSPKTLARYRVTGAGPVYHKLGRRVRYLRKDLRKWAKERRRKSTSDDGTALAAGNSRDADASISASDPHIAALVKLVSAVARREALPGYSIHAGGGSFAAGVRLIETWRGPRFRALVLEADPLPSASADGAAGLAGTIARSVGTGRIAALWLAAPGTGPKGGRLAVAVVEPSANRASPATGRSDGAGGSMGTAGGRGRTMASGACGASSMGDLRAGRAAAGGRRESSRAGPAGPPPDG